MSLTAFLIGEGHSAAKNERQDQENEGWCSRGYKSVRRDGKYRGTSARTLGVITGESRELKRSPGGGDALEGASFLVQRNSSVRSLPLLPARVSLVLPKQDACNNREAAGKPAGSCAYAYAAAGGRGQASGCTASVGVWALIVFVQRSSSEAPACIESGKDQYPPSPPTW